MPFLRNCWYVAGSTDEVGVKPFARKILNEDVLFYRGDSGIVTAMSNICPHRFAPLDKGTLIGDVIRCPYHGLRFDPQGRCVSAPSGDAPPARAQLKVYPVVEQHDLLWIWMGDAALADPSAIPDFAYLDDPNFGWYTGYLYVQGHYELLVDNLLDLTHGEFLHPLLSSDGWCARNEQTITQTGGTIHVQNVARNDTMIPLFRQLRPDMPPVGTNYQEERWDAPSHLKLYFEFHSGGDKLIIPSAHFLTPETEKTTHYFVRGGHQDEIDNPAYTAANKAGVMAIFATEDVPMIEAQQRFIGEAAFMDCQPAILGTDNAAIRARRLLAKKIREEQQAVGSAGTAAAAA